MRNRVLFLHRARVSAAVLTLLWNASATSQRISNPIRHPAIVEDTRLYGLMHHLQFTKKGFRSQLVCIRLGRPQRLIQHRVRILPCTSFIMDSAQ